LFSFVLTPLHITFDFFLICILLEFHSLKVQITTIMRKNKKEMKSENIFYCSQQIANILQTQTFIAHSLSFFIFQTHKQKHTNTHTDTHTYTHTHTHILTHIHTHTHTHTHIHTYTHTRTHTLTNTHTLTHTHMHTNTQTNTHTHTHTHTHCNIVRQKIDIDLILQTSTKMFLFA